MGDCTVFLGRGVHQVTNRAGDLLSVLSVDRLLVDCLD